MMHDLICQHKVRCHRGGVEKRGVKLVRRTRQGVARQSCARWKNANFGAIPSFDDVHSQVGRRNVLRDISGVPPAGGSIIVDATPVLETPGYCRTVPIRRAPVARLRSAQALRDLRWWRNQGIRGKGERRDVKDPGGSTENSPPVYWRERALHTANRVPEGRLKTELCR